MSFLFLGFDGAMAFDNASDQYHTVGTYHLSRNLDNLKMSTGDFRVADISLADFGRKEIEIAEHEVGANSSTNRSLFFDVSRDIRSLPSTYIADHDIAITDAWTHGLPQGVRIKDVRRCPYFRLPPHDHPDRSPHRDSQGDGC